MFSSEDFHEKRHTILQIHRVSIRLRFDLAKATINALRGYQGEPNPDSEKIKDLDIYIKSAIRIQGESIH